MLRPSVLSRQSDTKITFSYQILVPIFIPDCASTTSATHTGDNVNTSLLFMLVFDKGICQNMSPELRDTRGRHYSPRGVSLSSCAVCWGFDTRLWAPRWQLSNTTHWLISTFRTIHTLRRTRLPISSIRALYISDEDQCPWSLSQITVPLSSVDTRNVLGCQLQGKCASVA